MLGRGEHHGDKTRLRSRLETRYGTQILQQFINEYVNSDISNVAVKRFTRNNFNGY